MTFVSTDSSLLTGVNISLHKRELKFPSHTDMDPYLPSLLCLHVLLPQWQHGERKTCKCPMSWKIGKESRGHLEYWYIRVKADGSYALLIHTGLLVLPMEPKENLTTGTDLTNKILIISELIGETQVADNKRWYFVKIIWG